MADDAQRTERVRTYIPRRGRMSPTATSALTRLLPVWGISAQAPPERLSESFPAASGGGPRPVVLEIGSGMGHTTAQMAQEDPDVGIVAVDVHTPGIASLLVAAEQAGLANIRVCLGDAVELMDHLAAGSLAGIRAYFPDPWPKTRHHKRRLVQAPFVRRAALLLQPGGTLHLATDVADYAQQMLAVCRAEPALDCGQGLVARPAWRPRTKFEARAEAAGRRTWDLLAVRR